MLPPELTPKPIHDFFKVCKRSRNVFLTYFYDTINPSCKFPVDCFRYREDGLLDFNRTVKAAEPFLTRKDLFKLHCVTAHLDGMMETWSRLTENEKWEVYNHPKCRFVCEMILEMVEDME
ncbi:hypothetical protein L596_027011 [Steinernema carpocapsae]|uniref:Uncharacterized protein n=1 Tax=Steinernema carpocapsae TaxID=34508 RepID=A0A4U5M378_STECR|nr:hypothetical protein L596_027011 [Steinernema carpocapsae]